MTQVKICGVTRVRDVELAVDAGADSIGINLFPGSPRYVSAETARPLVEAVPPLVTAVGVVVELSIDLMKSRAEDLRVSTIQRHSKDGPPVVRDAAITMIPAFRIRSQRDLARVEFHRQVAEADGSPWPSVLVDGYRADVYGGTGVKAPWDLLERHEFHVPWILAGGLTPDNVADAIRRLRPWAVDVCSGVESAPGVKDIIKIRDFIAAVRGVNASQ